MDPYKVLGVSPNASDDEIKKAYRELSKKYHPDLNPGDQAAAEKMSEINAAYDMIQKGNYSSASGSGYSSYGGFGTYGYNYGGGDTNTERNEYKAAVNYIRNGMYREALTVLQSVPVGERDGKWYYYHANANMYAGNKVAAMEDARKACELDSDNAVFRSFLEQLQNRGNSYNNYTVKYNSGLSPDRLCCTIMAASLCCSGGGGFPLICCL